MIQGILFIFAIVGVIAVASWLDNQFEKRWPSPRTPRNWFD